MNWPKVVFKPETLALRRPFGSILRQTVVIGILTIFLLELILRQPPAEAVIFPTNFGTGHVEFGIKVAALDSLVKLNGPIDCLFIGSSVTDADIVPEVFDAAYQSVTGRVIKCFNFALAGTPAREVDRVARFILARYKPSLIVYSVSALEFSDDFNRRGQGLFDHAWINYIAGDYTVEGWLIDNIYTYRYVSSLRYYSDYEYHNLAIDFWQHLSPNGTNRLTSEFHFAPSEIQYPAYQLNSDGRAGFERLLQLDSGTVQLLLVEEPIQPAYFQQSYIAGGPTEYDRLFLDPIKNATVAQGVQFIENNGESLDIPESGWADSAHLNVTGASVFSSWLGIEVGRLALQGQLRLTSK